MQKQHLRLLPIETGAEEAPQVQKVAESPLLHLRITGRHGVFLLQRGEDQLALVDTRGSETIACTCGQIDGEHDGECEHVAILRACGFLQRDAQKAA